MAGPHAVSVYYPFALTGLVSFVQGDDYEETGDVLLIFTDEEGCHVTLRLRPPLADTLAKRLQSPPEARPNP